MWKKRLRDPLRRILCALLCIITIIRAPIDSYAKTIRKIEADDSQVIGIHTALGYSTIIEFPTKPTSAVLGDQDAFKLEYVGNSITVKPLVPRATSNLFIFTESDRFNCTLHTGSAAQVDYLVKVSSLHKSYPVLVPGTDPTPIQNAPLEIRWRPIKKASFLSGYSLHADALGFQKGSDDSRAVTFIDFRISSRRSPYAFSPASMGVRQGAKFIPIESIYFDSLELIPKASPIHGKVAILNQDFDPRRPFTIIFAVPDKSSRSKPHRLEITISPGNSKKGIGTDPKKGV